MGLRHTPRLLATPPEVFSLCAEDQPLLNRWEDKKGNLVALGKRIGSYFVIEYSGQQLTYYFDIPSNTVQVAAELALTRESITDTFYRSAAPLFMQITGWESLHASAVFDQKGVVALCGTSGSGKSTLAHGLSLKKGLSPWADDAVMLRVEGESVGSHQLPFRKRLDQGALAYFKAANSDPQEPPDERAYDSIEDKPRPLKAVFSITPSTATATPEQSEALIELLSAAEALKALLADAYCFSLHDKARKRLMVENYLTIVAQVPVFKLVYPRRFDCLPSILDSIASVVKSLSLAINPA